MFYGLVGSSSALVFDPACLSTPSTGVLLLLLVSAGLESLLGRGLLRLASYSVSGHLQLLRSTFLSSSASFVMASSGPSCHQILSNEQSAASATGRALSGDAPDGNQGCHHILPR